MKIREIPPSNIHVVLRDFSEFSNLDLNIVTKEVEESWDKAQSVWNKYVPTGSKEEIHRLYASREYLYLVQYAFQQGWKGHHADIIDFMKNVEGSEVLDFGGGSGQLCLMMYFASNKNITYLDLKNTETVAFAKWRFQKYKVPIKIIEAEIDNCVLPLDTYSYVVSDAVLEHVINLEQIIKAIYDSMKSGGFFYLLFDSSEHPSHLHRSCREIMEAVGFKPYNSSIWIKEKRGVKCIGDGNTMMKWKV